MVLKYVYQNACLLLEEEKYCSLNLWSFSFFIFFLFCNESSLSCELSAYLLLVVLKYVYQNACLLLEQGKACSLNLLLVLIIILSFALAYFS